ncbi:MAG: 2-succinyl-6-hydroxy-2,4-cyclohexadiene-1-carboxylate synthase [Raoultibacter sp.]|jgi:2-succinyl-6-hydroxy-2,4-cyclohexadiene-1-carboxylate synthase
MATFFHKGVTYHVSMWGDRRKAPLVMLHGFSQSSDTWKTVAEELAETRFILAPDFVGHGQSESSSDAEAYTMRAIRDWLTALVQSHWINYFDLLGYSMGGRIALSYAVENPHAISSLILESTGLGPASEQQREAMSKRDREMIDKLESVSIEAFMDEWENLPVFESQKQLSPEKRAALRAARLANNPQALRLTMLGSGQHLMPDYSQAICRLPMPILYLAGMLDRRYTKIAEQLQYEEHISCRLLNAGHNIHFEEPEAFTRQVNAFLRDLSPLGKDASYL